MTTESIFTLIAILLAGYTLIPIEDKKLIVLKFTKLETWLITLASVFILYLILLFEHFVSWFPYWKTFTNTKGLTSNEYAFVFCLSILIFIGYKVLKSKFPRVNRKKLIEYYKYLAGIEKYNLLFDLITKYEQETLVKIHFDRDSMPRTEEEIQNYELLRTIFDEKVIENFTKNDPYFYSKLIGKITGAHIFIDSIQYYYRVLISNSSSPLIRELRDNKVDNLLLEDKPLLSGIIGDPKIASEYKIYQAVGNYCKELIRIEKDNLSYSDYNRAYYNDNILWTLPVTPCIHFFNLMISEAIYKKHEDFLWLNYYERFIQMICVNIDTSKLSFEDRESEFPTYNHKLIDVIFDNTASWLSLASENYFKDCISPSILTSLFSSLTYLSDSSNSYISNKFKVERFESVIHIYFEVCEEIQSQYIEAIFSRFGDKSENFNNLFAIAWDKLVDDVWAGQPFDHEIPKVDKYVKEVIEKLDINTEFRGDWLK